jgi:hypothetical protein
MIGGDEQHLLFAFGFFGQRNWSAFPSDFAVIGWKIMNPDVGRQGAGPRLEPIDVDQGGGGLANPAEQFADQPGGVMQEHLDGQYEVSRAAGQREIGIKIIGLKVDPVGSITITTGVGQLIRAQINGGDERLGPLVGHLFRDASKAAAQLQDTVEAPPGILQGPEEELFLEVVIGLSQARFADVMLAAYEPVLIDVE